MYQLSIPHPHIKFPVICIPIDIKLFFYDKLGASYLPDGMAVDATGSCVDKKARDVNLSKHSRPKRRYAKEQHASTLLATIWNTTALMGMPLSPP
mmetsp:Transcript_38992/g.81977  ORF Transcript_38992/g.81977 Transcript_38992/m.81977 type:complete len:95 (+) Transcript_38992:367-651(+)